MSKNGGFGPYVSDIGARFTWANSRIKIEHLGKTIYLTEGSIILEDPEGTFDFRHSNKQIIIK